MQWMRMHKPSISMLLVVGLLSGGFPFTNLGMGQPTRVLAQGGVVFAAQQPDVNEEIIYIDSAGRIQVLDTNVTGAQKIEWSSPEDGFRAFAVGDVQADGDYEIVGIKGDGSTGRVVVYDPVVNSSTLIPDGEINGVPWKKLFDRNVGFTPLIVEMGNLDDGIQGDEIIFGIDTGSDTSRLIVMKSDKPTPDGLGWLDHIDVSFSRNWNHIAVGEIVGGTTAEVILTDSDLTPKSNLEAYRVDNGGLASRSPFFVNESSSNRWTASAIGQVYAGGTGEVVAIRRTSANGPANIFIFKYSSSQGLAEDEPSSSNNNEGDAIFIFPDPSAVWLANITGVVDGETDDEAFFLREVNVDTVRLIARNRGKDKLISDIEQKLDTDNGWKVGAGGDVDGDGREELILMRSNKIRVYTDPNANMNFNEFSLANNSRSLKAADLDRNGFTSGPAFQTETTTINVEAFSGEQSNTQSVQLTSTKPNVPFTVRVQTGINWITDLLPTSGQTDALITFRVDATNLDPGSYTTQLIIDSSDPEVINKPYTIIVAATINPSRVLVSPPSVTFEQFPCTSTITTTQTINVNVSGTDGVQYTAAILDLPTIETLRASLEGLIASAHFDGDGNLIVEDDAGNAVTVSSIQQLDVHASQDGKVWPSGVGWAAASSQTGIVDDRLTLAYVPGHLTEETRFAQAVLLLWLDQRTGAPPENLRFVTINYNCPASRAYAPIIGR